ncbi:hypothetical protein A3B40_04895 [Candidatus Roizmanbacteria bacterium RIFCSPLOWO2_01_FULL_37_16]|uniref:PIN domain-containing protein n=1 Tax=Candidatus Roizmanbacteria bacterium RIFCSPLOWO2_01_FULL_37_16 TaxID=1802058 RepID=A0A1F7IMU5_9BACT|nr:MAG: hypothetical protein A3B40_04895 [Candidatus Roizmanbacteria bacterium RIFCSPLOWO2_01_FULL_37_16]
MKIVMDADCLIKITKAGLKEDVCSAFDITIPHLVKEEIVDRGKVKKLPDALVIERNIREKLIQVDKKREQSIDVGEKEAMALFQNGGYDAIGSDDKRFVKQLRLFNIPYVTPAVFITIMLKQGDIKAAYAEERLLALSEFISESEYFAVKLFMEQWRSGK